MPTITLPTGSEYDGQVRHVTANDLGATDPVVIQCQGSDVIYGNLSGRFQNKQTLTLLIVGDTVTLAYKAATNKWVIISSSELGLFTSATFAGQATNGNVPLIGDHDFNATVSRTGVGLYTVTLTNKTAGGINLVEEGYPKISYIIDGLPLDTTAEVYISDIDQTAGTYDLEVGQRNKNGQYSSSDFIGNSLIGFDLV